MSIPSEAWRDAPRALRKVRHREAFTDSLGGVPFVDGAAQAGMPESVLSRLLGCGVPLVDLGAWVDPPAPVEPPAADADLAALPSEPAPDDAPGVSVAHPAPPAPSASAAPLRIPYNLPPLSGPPQPPRPSRDERRRGR